MKKLVDFGGLTIILHLCYNTDIGKAIETEPTDEARKSKMAIRKNENYSNRSKYSAQDNVGRKQAEAEQDSATDDFLAASKAKYAERKAVVITGLVSKYHFSQVGAETVANLIATGENVYGERAFDNAKFATDEMKQAAQRAYDYFWK